LGFFFNAGRKGFQPQFEEKALLTTGLIATFISIICGLVTAISRLIDFRTTLEKIKNEINESSKEVLQD
jgi:hypothetical protein